MAIPTSVTIADDPTRLVGDPAGPGPKEPKPMAHTSSRKLAGAVMRACLKTASETDPVAIRKTCDDIAADADLAGFAAVVHGFVVGDRDGALSWAAAQFETAPRPATGAAAGGRKKAK
jgi:hypothetical protein